MTELQMSPIQRSPEWFMERLGKFTASEIHKLMKEPRSKTETLSEGAKTYIMERVAEQITQRPASSPSGPALDWGIENEPLARKWYTRITGNVVEEVGFVPYEQRAGGSPDGLIGETGLIEIKCPWNTANHLYNCMLTPDTIKAEAPEYYWQIQANLLFTGRKWAHLVSFDPRIDSDLGLFILNVSYNADDQDLIKTKIATASAMMEAIISQLNSIKQS